MQFRDASSITELMQVANELHFYVPSNMELAAC